MVFIPHHEQEPGRVQYHLRIGKYSNTTNPSDIWANHSYWCGVNRAEPEEFVINTVIFLKLAIRTTH